MVKVNLKALKGLETNEETEQEFDVTTLENFKIPTEIMGTTYCSYGDYFKLIDGKYYGVNHEYGKSDIVFTGYNGKVLTQEEFDARKK